MFVCLKKVQVVKEDNSRTHVLEYTPGAGVENLGLLKGVTTVLELSLAMMSSSSLQALMMIRLQEVLPSRKVMPMKGYL